MFSTMYITQKDVISTTSELSSASLERVRSAVCGHWWRDSPSRRSVLCLFQVYPHYNLVHNSGKLAGATERGHIRFGNTDWDWISHTAAANCKVQEQGVYLFCKSELPMISCLSYRRKHCPKSSKSINEWWRLGSFPVLFFFSGNFLPFFCLRNDNYDI